MLVVVYMYRMKFLSLDLCIETLNLYVPARIMMEVGP